MRRVALHVSRRDGPARGASQRRTIDVDGTPVDAVTLRVGNPQCVVLGEVTRSAAARDRGARWPSIRCFPQGSNVELATVEAPDRVRILIWERGVGPTEASGTGACAAAVAAIAYGGAARDVQVVSRRHPARRVARRRALPYRLGGGDLRRPLAAPESPVCSPWS